jgi:hypothetical protein
MKKALSIFFTLLSLHVFSQQIIPCNDTISSFSHNTYEYYSKNPEQIFSDLDYNLVLNSIKNKDVFFDLDTIKLCVEACAIRNLIIYHHPHFKFYKNDTINNGILNLFQLNISLRSDTLMMDDPNMEFLELRIVTEGLPEYTGTYSFVGDTIIFKMLKDEYYSATIAKIKQNNNAVITKKYRLKLQGRILLLIAIKD